MTDPESQRSQYASVPKKRGRWYEHSELDDQIWIGLNTFNLADKPPNYFNLIGQLNELRKSDKKSPVKVGQSVFEVLCNSVFFGIFLVIASLLPIAQLVIGKQRNTFFRK